MKEPVCVTDTNYYYLSNDGQVASTTPMSMSASMTQSTSTSNTGNRRIINSTNMFLTFIILVLNI